MAQGKAG